VSPDDRETLKRIGRESSGGVNLFLNSLWPSGGTFLYNGVEISMVRNSFLLSDFPWIFFGFGTRDLTEKGLRARARERGMRLILLDQIHSDLIHIIEHAPSDRPQGDALVTAVPGLLLAIKTADCLPILMTDARLRVVAAVHAGWRGTRSRILQKTIRVMREHFGTDPADVLASLGPCIGPSCYEVGDDVRSEFSAAAFPDALFTPAGRPGKSFFDLWGANVLQLQSAGVPSDRITADSRCTHCDESLYSWRRDRDPSARLFSYIGLCEEGTGR